MNASGLGDVTLHQFPQSRPLPGLLLQRVNQVLSLGSQRPDPRHIGGKDLGTAQSGEPGRRRDVQTTGPDQICAGVGEYEVGKVHPERCHPFDYLVQTHPIAVLTIEWTHQDALQLAQAGGELLPEGQDAALSIASEEAPQEVIGLAAETHIGTNHARSQQLSHRRQNDLLGQRVTADDGGPPGQVVAIQWEPGDRWSRREQITVEVAQSTGGNRESPGSVTRRHASF